MNDMIGIMLCLYALIALFVLAENSAPKRARADVGAVARNVLEAVVWPLALLPWREWSSQLREWVLAVPVRYGELT